MTPSQNAPKVGALASAAWSAVVLYGASFVELPGDQALASTAKAAVVTLVIVLPAWLIGRFVQKRYTEPRERGATDVGTLLLVATFVLALLTFMRVFGWV